MTEVIQRLLGEKPTRDYSKNKRVLEKKAKAADKEKKAETSASPEVKTPEASQEETKA